MSEHSLELCELRERFKTDEIHLCYQRLLSTNAVQQLVGLVKSNSFNLAKSKPLLKSIPKVLLSSFTEDMFVRFFECILVLLEKVDDGSAMHDDQIASIVLLILLIRTLKRSKLLRSFFSKATPRMTGLHLIVCFDIVHTVLNESTSSLYALSPFLSQPSFTEFLELMGKKEILQLLQISHTCFRSICLRQYCLALCVIQKFYSLPLLSGFDLADCELFWNGLRFAESKSRIETKLTSHPLVAYLYRTLAIDSLTQLSISARDLLLSQKLTMDSLGVQYSVSSIDGEMEVESGLATHVDFDSYAIYQMLFKLNANPSSYCMD